MDSRGVCTALLWRVINRDKRMVRRTSNLVINRPYNTLQVKNIFAARSFLFTANLVLSRI